MPAGLDFSLSLSFLPPEFGRKTGIGIALFACGVRFLGVFWRKDALLATAETPSIQ